MIMSSMFQDCNELEYLDLSNFNTSYANNMKQMLSGCKKLKEIKGINNFDTSQVIDMNSMFQDCNELEYLDLSNFNTSNVNDMGFMFDKCYKLKEIKGINNFNTINVNDMDSMFQECTELRNLDLSSFNTSNVNSMRCMFQECKKLEFIDLSKFNTAKVKDMEGMFGKCYKLKEIKGILNFDLRIFPNMIGIFEKCNELKIYDEILSNIHLKLKEQISIPMEELNSDKKKEITVHLTSLDQKIKFTITCFNTDIFSTILEKLYLKFPQLKNKNIYYLASGNIINKSVSLAQNKIINDTNILINFFD